MAESDIDSMIMGVNENLRKIQQENDYQQTKNAIYNLYGAKEACIHLENMKFVNEKLEQEKELIKSQKNLTDENIKKAVEERFLYGRKGAALVSLLTKAAPPKVGRF